MPQVRETDGGVTVEMRGNMQLLTCRECGRSKTVLAHIARERGERGYTCTPCERDLPSPKDMTTEEPDDIIV